jgi:KaiC/GvpD/RAD55 family RecA-like ATPase
VVDSSSLVEKAKEVMRAMKMMVKRIVVVSFEIFKEWLVGERMTLTLKANLKMKYLFIHFMRILWCLSR